MKSFKKVLFVLAFLLIFTGCSVSKENNEDSNEIETVSDTAIVDSIKNNVNSLESVKKTLELYKKGNAKIDDYTKDDKLLVGLNTRFNNGALKKPTQAQLAASNLTNIDGVITTDEVVEYSSRVFGDVTLDYSSKEGCPSYIYNATEKLFYVKYGCSNETDSDIISYVDEVTHSDNVYYANVYVGIIDSTVNKVYGNVDKTKFIADINADDSYSIDSKNKEQFDLFVYTFTKNKEGNYVFTSIEKK